MINAIGIGLILLITSGWVIFQFRRTSQSEIEGFILKEETFTIETLVLYIKESIHDITRSNLHEAGLSSGEFQRSLNKRAELLKALKNCIHGSLQDKNYVKDIIFDILHRSALTPENIQQAIPFNVPGRLKIQDKFDILLYLYKKEYGLNGLTELIDRYELDGLKIRKTGENGYVITSEEIERIYETESPYLTFEDQLDIVTQRVYQLYKGFSVIDEIRDMAIDGVSGGVSGQLKSEFMSREEVSKDLEGLPMHFESVWLFFRGKSIHLECLKFESEADLRRVCQNIYRYNNVGMLSQDIGYKVNELADGSRVVVVRPMFSESWAFFIRKFQTQNLSLEKLIGDDNSEFAIGCIRYLAKGARITALTGSQGSGKTTLLMAMVGEIYGTMTLRIQEMAFELNLRKLYPYRNILSFRETDTISGQQGLDVQKKTDGSVNILGEVATDPVAAWMIQMAQVASLFTLFTHHAKTAKDLVLSLRNSLLKCDVFRNEKVAEEQVVSVINFNVHLTRNHAGERYIERITEIIPIDQTVDYPRDYQNEAVFGKGFMDTTTEFYSRMTDRKTYRLENILNFKEGAYVPGVAPTDFQLNEIKKHLSESDAKDFVVFIDKWWGVTDATSP
jgi:pilus assembly protein CpaF